MIKKIKELILDNISLLEIKNVKNLSFPDFEIMENFNDKFEVKLTIDEIKEILEDENNFYIKENYNEIKNIINDRKYIENDIDRLNEKACYFSISEKIYIDPSYLSNCIKNDLDIILDVYEFSDTILSLDDEYDNLDGIFGKIIFPKLKKDYDDLYIDGIIELDKSSDSYNIFDNTLYYPDIKLDDKIIQVLCTNLHYSSYNNQMIPMNCYHWDHRSKSFKFGNMSEEEFIKLYEDIAVNGIKHPIFLNIDRGFLYTDNIEDNMILFISKILRLKEIPVILYASIDSELKDNFMDKYRLYNSELTESSFIYLQNDIEPYFMIVNKDIKFENKKYKELLSEESSLINNKLYYLSDNSEDEIEELTYEVDNETMEKVEKVLQKEFGED